MNLPAHPLIPPSGVDWLGDVREHWEAKRLKCSTSINDEAFPEATLPDFEFKHVDIGGVNTVDGITATEELAFENAPSRARRKVRPGHTVVSTVRTHLGAIAPIKNRPRTSSSQPALRSFAHARLSRPSWATRRAISRLSNRFSPARRLSATRPAMPRKSAAFSFPPLPEQSAIAAPLDLETAKLDALAGKVEGVVEPSQEFRSALIPAAVNGKIDVHGHSQSNTMPS